MNPRIRSTLQYRKSPRLTVPRTPHKEQNETFGWKFLLEILDAEGFCGLSCAARPPSGNRPAGVGAAKGADAQRKHPWETGPWRRRGRRHPASPFVSSSSRTRIPSQDGTVRSVTGTTPWCCCSFFLSLSSVLGCSAPERRIGSHSYCMVRVTVIVATHYRILDICRY